MSLFMVSPYNLCGGAEGTRRQDEKTLRNLQETKQNFRL